MEHMSLRIEPMTRADWEQVCAIYEEGIATGLGTFETKAPSWEEWDAARLPHSRLVARDERVLGWAALSPVSKRACYAGVAEVGVYVAAVARGRGIGRILLDALIKSAEAHGIWTLQGATIVENKAELGTSGEMRVPSCWETRTNWQARWRMARHDSDRAPEHQGGHRLKAICLLVNAFIQFDRILLRTR
jgi:L-amino acid N-acyltransferase YncA